MHKIEPIKRVREKATGIGIPSAAEALERVKAVKPRGMKFRADGYVPNNPRMPLLLYRGAVRFDREGDPAALLEAIFNANDWGDAWRNGIYDFVHYHPRIHEVLGVARGAATLRLGGNKGASVKVRAARCGASRSRRKIPSMAKAPRPPNVNWALRNGYIFSRISRSVYAGRTRFMSSVGPDADLNPD